MFSSKKKRRKYLRSIWGKEIEKFRDLDLIASYHNLLDLDDYDSIVDDNTWNDLDLDKLFAKIDRNISRIGQQYLYHILHKNENNVSTLKNRFELVNFLKNNRDIREDIQLSLFNLTDVSSYFAAYIILSKNLPSAKYYPFFYLCSFFSILSLILIYFNGAFLFAAITILLINLILNKIFSNKIYSYFNGFASLNSLIVSATAISKIKTGIQIKEIDLLIEKKNLLVSLKKKLGYLVIDKEALNDLTIVVIEYLNMFMLFDIIAYYRSVKTMLKNQEDIRAVFENVASLDAAVSIASYLEENSNYSNPLFNESGIISFKKLYHPLIKDAVSNSISNLTKSVLITGSNMAGKTTFIKTVGINVILSQTLYFSFSEEINIPKLIVKSAIRRNENMEEGKSYFFTEIETLNVFLKLSEKKQRYLFLIDEIFRGTNTIERLASSTAVLKYLEINNKVFVTTHDIELQDLLDDNFDMYHFSEQVEDDRFFFNYKIKEGPCSAGNAIKLLDIMNYPESIISEANSIVAELLNNSLPDKLQASENIPDKNQLK